MWRWIVGDKKAPADGNTNNGTDETDDVWEVGSYAGSESDVDIGDEEENLTRAVIRQLRDLRRRHNKYAETVDGLCKKVDGLLEDFQSAGENGAIADGEAATSAASDAKKRSIANQLKAEMSKLKAKADKLDTTKRASKRLGMFWNMTNEYEDTFEADYIAAIRRNDNEAVKKLLQDRDDVNLDVVGADGKFGVQIALENENVEIATLLFKHGVKIGITLLRLIESDCTSAVALICNHKRIFEENGEDIFAAHDTDDEFPVETTPIILAARMNRFQILKIFLKFGAVMPTLEETRSRFENRPGRARAVFHLCEAFSSEAYLLQNSDDLLRDVMETTEKIRDVRTAEKNSLEERGMRDEYTLLEERLEEMELRILNLVNGEEMDTLLNGDDPTAGKEFTCCLNIPENIPIRLCQALDLKHKKFIAHSKCQEYIWERWRYGFDDNMSRSTLKRVIASFLICIFWPILGLIYLILSGFNQCTAFLRLMRCPYVKFILTTSSRIILLLIVTFMMLDNTIFTVSSHDSTEDLEKAFIEYRTHSTLHPGIVWLWILGMTWRELTDICRQGARMYTLIGWSQIEIPQLILYWVYIIGNVVAYVETQLVVDSGEIAKLAAKKNMTDLLPCDIIQLEQTEVNDTEECVRFVSLTPQLGELESRLDWHAYEPLLIAEAAFAVANVLTFVRLLDATVLVAHVGILQVSLMKMFRSVIKFLCLYAFIWVSFSLGLTQLYRPYDDVKTKHCKATKGLDCEETHFQDLWQSMRGLFWTLFGYTDYDSLELPPNLHMTEAVGHFIFALYLLLTMVFLMNMLIAMLGGAFTVIEENADTEWKFARSTIMCEYVIDSAVVPPPLNLVPSTLSIFTAFSRICSIFSCCRRRQEETTTGPKIEIEKVEMEEVIESKKAATSLDYQILSAALNRRYIRDIMKKSSGFSGHSAVAEEEDEKLIDTAYKGSGAAEKDKKQQQDEQGENGNNRDQNLVKIYESLQSDVSKIERKLNHLLEAK